MNKAEKQAEEQRVNAEYAKLESQKNFISTQQQVLVERFQNQHPFHVELTEGPLYKKWDRLEKEKAKIVLQQQSLLSDHRNKLRRDTSNRKIKAFFIILAIAALIVAAAFLIVYLTDENDIGRTETFQSTISLTVNDTDTAKSYQQYEAKMGHRFLIVDMTIENISKQSFLMRERYFALNGTHATAIILDDLTIEGEERVEAKILFEIPTAEEIFKNQELVFWDECSWSL